MVTVMLINTEGVEIDGIVYTKILRETEDPIGVYRAPPVLDVNVDRGERYEARVWDEAAGCTMAVGWKTTMLDALREAETWARAGNTRGWSDPSVLDRGANFGTLDTGRPARVR